MNDFRNFFTTNKQEAISIKLFDELQFYLNHIQSLTYSLSKLDNNYNNEGIFPKLIERISNFVSQNDNNLKNRLVQFLFKKVYSFE